MSTNIFDSTTAAILALTPLIEPIIKLIGKKKPQAILDFEFAVKTVEKRFLELQIEYAETIRDLNQKHYADSESLQKKLTDCNDKYLKLQKKYRNITEYNPPSQLKRV